MSSRRTSTAASLAAAACLACGAPYADPPPAAGPPSVTSFSPAEEAVFVGERARLTAVFDGDGASVDGLGTVQSGAEVETGPLARTTTFTLHVRRGAEEVLASATVQVHYRDRFRALAPAPVGRSGHLAAALPDGRAVVMGGNASDTVNVPDSDTSALFDPASEAFSPGPQLLFVARAGLFTSATELPGGDVLLAGGGLNGGPDGVVGTQVLGAGGLELARAGSVAVRRPDGRVTPLADGGALLTGGAGLPPVAPVERWDPATGEWLAAGSLLFPRFEHTATLLQDGRVLVVGGIVCCVDVPGGVAETYTAAAEVYDPADGTFVQTGSLAAARGSHAATLLPDGRVLVTGGVGDDPAAPPLGAELYDPSTGAFGPAGELLVPRRSHAAVALTDGRVLVVGGADPATFSGVPVTELFEPQGGRWSAGPALNPAWPGSTVTLLAGGKVLVFGGETPGGFPVSTAVLFE